jgi:hypothetical protein
MWYARVAYLKLGLGLGLSTFQGLRVRVNLRNCLVAWRRNNYNVVIK